MFTNKAFSFFYLLLSLVQATLEICLEATKALIRHCVQPCRHTTGKAFQASNPSKGYLECCKCARMRFKCAARLVALRIWAPKREHCLRDSWIQNPIKKICQLNRIKTVVWHVHIASRLAFLYLIMVTSIGGKPKPEICFFPGRSRCSC